MKRLLIKKENEKKHLLFPKKERKGKIELFFFFFK